MIVYVVWNFSSTFIQDHTRSVRRWKRPLTEPENRKSVETFQYSDIIVITQGSHEISAVWFLDARIVDILNLVAAEAWAERERYAGKKQVDIAILVLLSLVPYNSSLFQVPFPLTR